MSHWRVQRQYGFGAARISLHGHGEAHRSSDANLRDGVGTWYSELTAGGTLATARRLLMDSPAILLALILVAAFMTTMLRDHSDVSPVEVVLLESFAPEPLPEIIPEPEPEPIPLAKAEPPKPEPVPELAPPPVVPEPEPPPVKLAERVPEPPPVKLAERVPEPPAVKPKPKPVLPEIARIEPPKRPPIVRPNRPARERPKAIERPRVKIDQVAVREAAPAPSPERLARRRQVEMPKAPRLAPRLDAPVAPKFQQPDRPAPNFRVAKARPVAGERRKTIPGIAPPGPRVQDSMPAAPNPRPSRATGSRPKTPPRMRAPAPALAAAAVPKMPSAVPAPARTARERVNSPAPRRASRPVPAQMARAPQMAVAPVPNVARRATRAAPTQTQTASADRPGVAGVPLGELAACLSDREEDRLKQAVVAAVKTQKQCVSRKGTYRFIETKNLNAFLMRIDRSGARAMEDRCSELSYALECLQGVGQTASR